MSQGVLYIGSAIYLTLLVAFVVSLLEEGFGPELVAHTLRRWRKFAVGLAVLAGIVQILTLV